MIVKNTEDSYIKRKYNKIIKFRLLNLIILFSVITALTIFYFIYEVGGNYWWVISIIGSLILIGFSFRNKDFREFIYLKEEYLKGINGEQIVSDKLSERFNDSYIYIRNYHSNKVFLFGDIDGILIGPRGIFLLEIKSWKGVFRILGTNFYRHISKYFYRLYYKNPIQQLLINKEIIVKYFLENSLSINVQSFIIFADGEIEKFDKNIGIYITKPEEISDKILERSNQNLSDEQIKKIVSLLGINL